MSTRVGVVAAAFLASTVSAHAAEWRVIKPDFGNCFVIADRAPVSGETQVGPVFASEAEATAEMSSSADCQFTNLDPGTE